MNRPRNQADQELKARARIYVANIPQAGMSRKEVVSVFHKYGEIDSKSLVCNMLPSILVGLFFFVNCRGSNNYVTVIVVDGLFWYKDHRYLVIYIIWFYLVLFL